MGIKNRIRNGRTDSLGGFNYWWEDLEYKYTSKKHSKEIMGKQINMDSNSNRKHTNDSRLASKRGKGFRVVSSVVTAIKLKIVKTIDTAKIYVYNVYCSIAKRKDNKMAKDEKITTTNKQSKNSKKAEKKQLNWFVSGIMTIGIAVAWVSAAYCVLLVNTGTGEDMFPKYASAPLALVLAGTFLVAIYKTVKNNNR